MQYAIAKIIKCGNNKQLFWDCEQNLFIALYALTGHLFRLYFGFVPF